MDGTLPIKIEKKEEEDEDEVVLEFPIYHSTRLQDNLYSFRYRLLEKRVAKNIKRAFYKPNSEQFRMHLDMDENSPYFDRDRAELVAQEVDNPSESRKSSEVLFERNFVDRVFLNSIKTVTDPEQHAAMIFNGKEIHLTTLKGIYDMQHSLDHLNRVSKKKKDTAHNNLSDDEEAGPSSVEQVTVKFSDDRWKNKPGTSKKPDGKDDKEPWVECKYLTEDQTTSNVEKLKLFADNLEDTGVVMDLSKDEYVNVVVPRKQEKTTDAPSLPSHTMTLHALKAKPVLEQCRYLLKVAQIIQFQQILMTLAGSAGLSVDALLKTLPKVAVLVRGNWVVKSEILYPKETFSSISGVPAELMCRARDYVLYLFTKNEYVERKTVSSVMKIPSEEVKEIFMGFSRLSHNKGWELALKTDYEFKVKHSDLVQRQNEWWENRFKQLSEYLKDNMKQRRKSKSISEDGRAKSGQNCLSSDNDSGTEKNKSPVAARKNKSHKKESSQDSSS